ncbi:hypothetical protein M427DRAFT_136150 [Gonapodya prolifera JEL478]|uniref:Uncharacterized protein n=1 Tax=Gonapodya prolifera (strain JEL478) TaxID=1344416 RepID=A0A139AAR3_GONPJ|nr:hypothetical protein M427DRAFT_136150 [Gonapodya prolifera JEL478]|eukprot:KXS13840.1 hypothetical protein M427DRAFT_136150 [Gonapodya prolifera JEL478]
MVAAKVHSLDIPTDSHVSSFKTKDIFADLRNRSPDAAREEDGVVPTEIAATPPSGAKPASPPPTSILRSRSSATPSPTPSDDSFASSNSLSFSAKSSERRPRRAVSFTSPPTTSTHVAEPSAVYDRSPFVPSPTPEDLEEVRRLKGLDEDNWEETREAMRIERRLKVGWANWAWSVGPYDASNSKPQFGFPRVTSADIHTPRGPLVPLRQPAGAEPFPLHSRLAGSRIPRPTQRSAATLPYNLRPRFDHMEPHHAVHPLHAQQMMRHEPPAHRPYLIGQPYRNTVFPDMHNPDYYVPQYTRKVEHVGKGHVWNPSAPTFYMDDGPAGYSGYGAWDAYDPAPCYNQYNDRRFDMYPDSCVPDVPLMGRYGADVFDERFYSNAGAFACPPPLPQHHAHSVYAHPRYAGAQADWGDWSNRAGM